MRNLTQLLIPSKLAVSSADKLQRVNLPYGIWFIRSIAKCRKIPKISPRAYIFQRPFLRVLFWRGLYSERLKYGGKFAFLNPLGQLVVGKKFTNFASFYFVFEGKFQVQAPQGAYILRGDLTEGFLRYDFRGLIFGGAHTWRGLFSEFYGTLTLIE